MGMPSIDVVFTEKANTSIRMAERGIMAIAVKDASQVENGQAYMLLSAADIPETLSDENKSYIERGFIGYVNPPVMRQPSTRSFMRLRDFSSVDFPQPDGPMNAVILFSGISRLIPLSALKSP